MGGTVGTRDPYDYSLSNDPLDDSFSGKRRNSRIHNKEGTKKLYPVKSDSLGVPLYMNRHPFQDYRFMKKLGEGSFSVVYKGICLSEDTEIKKIAIKEVDTSKLNKRQVADLSMEINILSQLHHTNIVELHSVYQSNDRKFLITEYLKGGQLLNAVCKRQKYTENDARKLMLQIVSALKYLHDRKVIHRDIKPENLILANHCEDSSCDDYVIKIVDFGFATIETDEIRKPSKYLCGTPGYMAPEILHDRSYSTKVDIWALGVVFYILLSGLMPFSIKPEGEQYVGKGEFKFPESRFGRISVEAKDLICRMLTVDVDQRISAQEIFGHPWMTSSIEEMNDSVEVENLDESICTNEIFDENDISENLESIRDHQALNRFQFASRILSTIISPSSRRNSSTTSIGKFDPEEFAKCIADEAKQAKMIDRLGDAIAVES